MTLTIHDPGRRTFTLVQHTGLSTGDARELQAIYRALGYHQQFIELTNEQELKEAA